MMKLVQLKKDHEQIKDLIFDIEEILSEDKIKINHELILSKIMELDVIWDTHEKREEEMFPLLRKNGMDFPVETMIIEQHKEMRGHWKIIMDAAHSNDENELIIALDTDGRMLFEKFRKHMEEEDKFFDEILAKKEWIW